MKTDLTNYRDKKTGINCETEDNMNTVLFFHHQFGLDNASDSPFLI